MSYEGYSQFLCKYGHYWTEDCYSADLRDSKCPHGHPAVWENMVNTTNGSYDEETGEQIDGYIELKIRSKRTCKHCGTVTEIRYKQPKATTQREG